MSVEEELKKDHADMQSIIDSKQKIIEAQVSTRQPQCAVPHTGFKLLLELSLCSVDLEGSYFILNECS